MLCSSAESVSAFEFLRSQLVERIFHFLTTITLSETNGIYSVENLLSIAELEIPEKEILFQRGLLFCSLFFNWEEQLPQSSQPIAILIGKIHQALNKQENFPVVLNEVPGTAASLKYLTQPFKAKLQPQSRCGVYCLTFCQMQREKTKVSFWLNLWLV